MSGAWDEAYKLANDKNLAATEVFYAVARARDESLALSSRLERAEAELNAERAQRTWAFQQLRSWWRGEPRDTSRADAAIAELDRVEAWLGALGGAAVTGGEGTDFTAAREQKIVRHWYKALTDAEKIDAQHGLVLPGDSALAVVLTSMDEAAHAGDPEFDSRVRAAVVDGEDGNG